MSLETPPIDPMAAARAYLAAVVSNPDARPADRLRAAEAILRAEPQAPTGSGLTADASDAELLALARGEGGRPPLMGPATGVTETGPIHANGDPFSNPFPTAGGPISPAAEKGPAKGGPKSGTPGPESRPPGLITPNSRKRAKRIEKESKRDDDIDPCS